MPWGYYFIFDIGNIIKHAQVDRLLWCNFNTKLSITNINGENKLFRIFGIYLFFFTFTKK